MTHQTHKPNEVARRIRIDEAIDESIQPSPDSAHAIAELVGEHPTLVVRRLNKRFAYRGGRWVRRKQNTESETE